jgi:CRISPR/Cas system CSM-associated protein Csm3 (group 7 of RAMP superfamily)
MYKTKDLPASVDRWRITGRITTESPMHIGDGDREHISTRECAKESLDDADPFYATIYTDHEHKPFIPATSLKGALRAWALAHGIDARLIGEVFGNANGGGVVTVHDARLERSSSPADRSCRFWCDGRSTGLSPQVVIDAGTRSAKESLLYYIEYVPAGTVFSIAMTSQNATKEQRSMLLYVLGHAFRSTSRPARLGSQAANGWGKANWSLTSIEVFDTRAWMSGQAKPWHQALAPLDDAAKGGWAAGEASFRDQYVDRSIRLSLTLDFDGAMLVNDPTRRKRANSRGEGAVSHAMVRREDGSVYLPARSIRGAFRSQASRIWQTLGWASPTQNLDKTYHNDVRRSRDKTRLAGFFKMFGATGWRSPLEFPDFELEGRSDPRIQEFVAIDRFTGGAAPEKKFNAHFLWKPTFKGALLIRTDRWADAGVGSWGWLLLAFTLRDWADGDGTIGFGRSKGYGGFTVRCDVQGPEPEVELLRGILRRDAEALASPELEKWSESLATELAREEEAA